MPYLGNSVQDAILAILRAMDSGDLSADQLDAFSQQLDESCRYLVAVKARMSQGKFPYGDKLRRQVNSAADAVQALQMAVHYMKCDWVSGRQPNPTTPTPLGYHVDVVLYADAPVPPLNYWKFVEAETPLEALIKLARQGRLSPVDKFWARVALEVGDDNRPAKVLTIPLTSEITMPSSGRLVSAGCQESMSEASHQS